MQAVTTRVPLLNSIHKALATKAVVGVVVAICSTTSVHAKSSEKASGKPNDLIEKYEQSRKGVVEAETQKRKVLGSLYTINQRMKRISSEKNSLNDELFQVQDNVKNIAKKIAGLEVQIKEQRHHLRRRLRALYKLSGEGYIGILFSQNDPRQLDETMRFLKIVTDNDHQAIRSFQDNIAAYTQQRDRLRGQVEKLVAIERNIKKQEGLLVSEHKSKSKIVAELDRERAANMNRIKSLRRGARDSGLDDLLKPSMFEKKGQLPSPIVGRLAQDFGPVTDEKYRIRLSHKGWRYEAERGTPVTSIFDGRVVFSDWINGYGQTVIVDHGDHYYSLYAHISRVKVRTGDNLNVGQLIAEAGPSARGFGDGLYFEIRHFSEPENPRNWIDRKTSRGSSVDHSIDHSIDQQMSHVNILENTVAHH